MNRTLDFVRLCEDLHIPHATSGNKHCRKGWVQIHCPFCPGDQNFHLGFNLRKGYFNCWRCGARRTVDVIGALSGGFNARNRTYKALSSEIWAKYGIRLPNEVEYEPKIVERDVEVRFPMDTGKLKKAHRTYLRQRRFDPEHLERIWKLQGTGYLGLYKFRIIAPIFFRNKLVSFQGRDITGTHKLRYMACKQDHEARDHKTVLYGFDFVRSDSVVVCEGITDVWRMGPGAVATFGIKFSMHQVFLLTHFANVFILFDSLDEQAIQQAHKLARMLAPFCRHVEVVEVPDVKDPAELEQNQADELMKELMS